MANTATFVTNLMNKDQDQIDSLKQQLRDASELVRAARAESEKWKQSFEGSQEEIDSLNSRLEGTYEQIRELNEELEKLKTDSGIAFLEEELDRFRETAKRSLEEFKMFLKTVNLNDEDFWGRGTNDWRFEELFRQIQDGCKTTSQAIVEVKTEYASLIEENWQNADGVFNQELVKSLQLTLSSLGETIDSVHDKVNSIMENGVPNMPDGGGSIGGLQNLTSLFEQIELTADRMSDGAREAYEPVENLVRAMTDYANIDSARILGVSQAFKGIASIGEGKYGTKSIENIINLVNQLKSVSESGMNAIRFDFSGLNDLTVKKSSLNNMATYLPQIAAVNAENLQAIASIDWSNLTNLKVSKSNIENIYGLTKALQDMYTAQSGTDADAPNITGDKLKTETGQIEELTKRYDEHKKVVDLAVQAEEKKAEVAGRLAGALKTEKAATESTVDSTREHVEALAQVNRELTEANLDEIKDRLKMNNVRDSDADKIAEDFKDLSGQVTNVSVSFDKLGENSTRVSQVIVTSMNRAGDTLRQTAQYVEEIDALTGERTTTKHVSGVATVKYADPVKESKRAETERYNEATRAVEQYHKALMALLRSESDIIQTSNGMWVSVSGSQNYQQLEQTLNDATAAVERYAGVNARAALSTEHQARLDELAAQRARERALAVEQLENKQRAATEAQKVKDDNRAEVERYNAATAAINRYYEALMQALAVKNGMIVQQDDGTWVALDARYDELVQKLNETKEAFDAVTKAMEDHNLSAEHQSKLEQQIADAKVKYAQAQQRAEEESLRTSQRDARERNSVEQNYISLLTQGEDALRQYTAAEHSKNSESREAYSNLKNATEALRAARAEYDASGGSNGAVEKLRRAEENYNKVLGETKRLLAENGDNVKSFGDRIKDAASKFSMWFSMSRILMSVYREIRKMISTSIELDQTMTQLRIVTKASEEEMTKFGDAAAASAKKVGASITDLTSSATTFARLGYSLSEAETLAEYTTMLQNVGNIEVADAQDAITAIIKAYSDIDISEIEQVMDRLVTVGKHGCPTA